MHDINQEHISTDPYALPIMSEKGISADILRLDKLHPVLSGNKWFKLRYYIDEARQQNKDTLVTFGGAWSNHIHATAFAGRLYGLKTAGIIRGEEAPAERFDPRQAGVAPTGNPKKAARHHRKKGSA